VYPIQLRLEKGATLRIERQESGRWLTAAEDDDTQLEVWSRGKVTHGWEYEVRWVPGTRRGPFRLQVLDTAGAPWGEPSAPCSPGGR
jgi:hypothetical protein